MHLQENTLFDLDIGVKVTRTSVHHVTYGTAKFEIGSFNGLG